MPDLADLADLGLNNSEELRETQAQQQQTLVLLTGRLSQLACELNILRVRNLQQSVAIKVLAGKVRVLEGKAGK